MISGKVWRMNLEENKKGAADAAPFCILSICKYPV